MLFFSIKLPLYGCVVVRTAFDCFGARRSFWCLSICLREILARACLCLWYIVCARGVNCNLFACFERDISIKFRANFHWQILVYLSLSRTRNINLDAFVFIGAGANDPCVRANGHPKSSGIRWSGHRCRPRRQHSQFSYGQYGQWTKRNGT